MNETKEPKLPPGTLEFPPIDRPNPVRQVDPSKPYAYYRFEGTGSDGAVHMLAELLAFSEDVESFKAYQEYWRFDQSRIAIDTLEFEYLNVKKQSGTELSEPPFRCEDASFVCSQEPHWVALPQPSVPCHHYDESFGPCGLRLQVNRPDRSSKDWKGEIAWIRPMQRIAPLFLSRNDYHLTKVTVEQGQTVTNVVGTSWTAPITNYGDGDWRAPVVSTEFATGLQVVYDGTPYGIVNARLVYANGTFSAWASDDDTGGVRYPPDDKANLDHPVDQVTVRTGWYLNYKLGLVDLDCGVGWVTGFPTDKSNNPDILVSLPARCAVVGIQGKKRPKYGLVDIKLAYRELP